MDVLTRKIGPLPGWAWGLGAAALAAAIFLYMRNRGAAPGASTGGSLVNNPAASSVPYVPSVTVTGIPPSQPSQVATNGPSLGALWQFGPAPSGPTVWQATQVGQTNFAKATGGSWPGGVRPGQPDQSTMQTLGGFGWQWASVPSGVDPASYAQQLNGTTGGQGGWGYAGNAAPAGAVGGWTVGWSPAAAGPGMGGQGGPSSVNRTGASSGRDMPAGVRAWSTGYGGQGGHGSTGAGRATRTVRNLRRRDLSYRR